jgi:hypothetical protein
MAVVAGSAIDNAVKRFNLNPEQKKQLERSLENQKLVDDIKKQVDESHLKTVELINRPFEFYQHNWQSKDLPLSKSLEPKQQEQQEQQEQEEQEEQ